MPTGTIVCRSRNLPRLIGMIFPEISILIPGRLANHDRRGWRICVNWTEMAMVELSCRQFADRGVFFLSALTRTPMACWIKMKLPIFVSVKFNADEAAERAVANHRTTVLFGRALGQEIDQDAITAALRLPVSAV